MCGDSSAPRTSRPLSSFPCLLAPSGLLAGLLPLFTRHSLKSVPQELCFLIVPLPLANPDFPNEFREIGVFSPQSHRPLGHTAQEKASFPCLPLWDKTRRAPPSLQKSGEVSSSPVPCILLYKATSHSGSTGVVIGKLRQGESSAWGIEPQAAGMAPGCTDGCWTDGDSGTQHWRQERDAVSSIPVSTQSAPALHSVSVLVREQGYF